MLSNAPSIIVINGKDILDKLNNNKSDIIYKELTTQEKYLVQIHNLLKNKHTTSNLEISNSLNKNPGTVSKIVQKLKNQSLIVVERVKVRGKPDKIKLTEKGLSEV